MTGTLFQVDQGRVLGTSPDSGQRTSRHLMMSRNIIPGEILSAIKFILGGQFCLSTARSAKYQLSVWPLILIGLSSFSNTL